jgi:prepilin-type N-terminal cleavage/methylation domain-containing protein
VIVRGQAERGFSLIEVLVTVVIVGIAFIVIVGGLYTALVASDHHRKQANVQAALRNVAEALKGVPYVNCASTSNYGDALVQPRTSGSSTASGTSHSAPSLAPAQANAQLLVFYALANGSSFTPPTSTAERWDVVSTGNTAAKRVTAEFADLSWPSAAATGTRVATSAASGSSASHAVLLENSANIVRRGVSTAVSGGATTLAIAKPSGTVFGDAMVAQIAVRGGTTTVITPPAGWALVSTVDNGTALKSAIYQRTATGTTASYTWTFNPSVEAAGGIVSYRGVNDFVASLTTVKHWTGTTFSTPDPCPGTDKGLQLLTVSVDAPDPRAAQSVDVVKRRP